MNSGGTLAPSPSPFLSPMFGHTVGFTITIIKNMASRNYTTVDYGYKSILFKKA